MLGQQLFIQVLNCNPYIVELLSPSSGGENNDSQVDTQSHGKITTDPLLESLQCALCSPLWQAPQGNRCLFLLKEKKNPILKYLHFT